MPKRISHAEDAPLRAVIVTLDGHLADAAMRAFERLGRVAPEVQCSIHCAGEWGGDPKLLERCKEEVASANIVIACMLFVDEHIQAILPSLEARRPHCDAMLCFVSSGEIMRLTRIGNFDMSAPRTGPLRLLSKLRGSKGRKPGSDGARQLKMLRRLPRILKFIPGTAQDIRVYFLAMQYWLAGSEDNIRNLIAMSIVHYADGERRYLRDRISVEPPAEYPETGLYHPRASNPMFTDVRELPKAPKDCIGTVGLLLMRSYVLSGNVRHYDHVIQALEDRGLRVVPAFAGGLDSRSAVSAYFHNDQGRTIDALVSLTGFSLVGGPAYNDSQAAIDVLSELDVPYVAAHATEFQSLESWSESDSGLLPVETTMMIAIPELDGAVGPILFGGRSQEAVGSRKRDLRPQPERTSKLAARVARMVKLRSTPASQRKLAIVLFNFPPNSGSVGTAAHLDVFSSLFNTLKELSRSGYNVDLPENADALRDSILKGNSDQFGSDANVCARIDVDSHVRTLPWLSEIEKAWGPAPGKHQTDGRSLHVLGKQFGNILVGIQPSFGYEGDPMRLLFDRNLAPTHAFTAFYQYLANEFSADALLHFGTHGGLEFMPGKQSGMSEACWPDRLIGEMPNFYLYAANNPSEGTIAKRRSGATLVTYLTPPLAQAGLYSELNDLQSSIDRWRGLEPINESERNDLARLIQEQASGLDLAEAEPVWAENSDGQVTGLIEKLREFREALIPVGLHVLGENPDHEQRQQWLKTLFDEHAGENEEDQAAALARFEKVESHLQQNQELASLMHALEGGFVKPAPGGDLLNNPDILPTGRNMHGFDPSRLPSQFAMRAGARQADQVLQRYVMDSGDFPQAIAMVLWGSDNLKSEGGPIAQALWLMGAKPRTDSYGRLCGAELISLEELGRPRIDVVMTLSGIFRDLLPAQTKLLAEAAWLAASAEEPLDQNYIRAHALAYQDETRCDLESACLRVFSNAAGAYGSNVNHLVEDGSWSEEDELAEQFSRRKCFAYGREGGPNRNAELLNHALAHVDLTFQNLESAELGVTTIDHYFDTLGGISRAAKRAKGGKDVEIYIGDQTRGKNVVRTLADQVELETRTRLLNPTWYEGLLEHGYEGVRQIESHVSNTMGWSATTHKVAPWVYQQLTKTFVLDDDMRRRLAKLNPVASARVANRLLEAYERNYWQPDEETLAKLEQAGEELEDHLEGVSEVAAA